MSKFLLDENLSRKLVTAMGIMDISQVCEKGLLQSFDSDIWNFAKREGFTLITKDNDFRYLSNTYDCPPKVIKLNCGNKSTSYIASLLINLTEEIQNFILSKDLCYLEIG